MWTIQGISVIPICICVYRYSIIFLVWCNQNMLGRSISVSPYFFVAAEIIWFVSAMWHRPWVKSFQDGCQKSSETEATCWIKQRDATSLIILQFGGLTSETIFNSTNRWASKQDPVLAERSLAENRFFGTSFDLDVVFLFFQSWFK